MSPEKSGFWSKEKLCRYLCKKYLSGGNRLCYKIFFLNLKIYNCMTSSICSFMNSFLGFWSELTNCKYIWLLFLPEALHPLGNMPVHGLSMQPFCCSMQSAECHPHGEGDRKRMREARRTSACPLTQKDLFS